MTRAIRFIIFAILSLSLFLIGIGGIGGGVVFILDPSGGLMGMPLSYLDGLPLHSYVLPGLWLLTAMGAGSLLILYGLWAQPAWGWTAPLERRSHAHWAWTAALALCVVLLLQLGVELLLRMLAPPTFLTGGLAVVALACLLVPAVRAAYRYPASRS